MAWQRRRILILLLGLSTFAAAPPAQSRGDKVEAWAREWLDAVRQHPPGALPDASYAIGRWEWDKLQPVIRLLRGRSGPLADEPDGNLLMVRAAAMYLDLSRLVPLDELPTYPTVGRSLRSDDGRPEGLAGLNSQIWWARHLIGIALDRRDPAPDELELSVLWYRAATAQLAEHLHLADLRPHLADAVRQFPDDPRILFDAGCMEETFAAPPIQAAADAFRPQPGYLGSPAVASVNSHLGDAERLLRRALAGDPAFVEARLRLGRVMALRGRMAEALTEFQAVARLETDRAVRYYALLFLGSVQTDMRQYDSALDAFAEAARIFPRSQAPHLGAGRVHVERGELARARAAMSDLLRSPRETRQWSDDPWWSYHRCAGRESASAYSTFVRAMQRTAQ